MLLEKRLRVAAYQLELVEPRSRKLQEVLPLASPPQVQLRWAGSLQPAAPVVFPPEVARSAPWSRPAALDGLQPAEPPLPSAA
jgi:hypothetical protein